MDLYKEETTHMLHQFLNNTFFKVWQNWDKEGKCREEHLNFRKIELQISPACDLKCKYCLPKGSRILMKDLTWKCIEDIRVGDIVIGVENKKTTENTNTGIGLIGT